MKLYRVFIPKLYNDKRPIEEEKKNKILRSITEKFNGCSITPSAKCPVVQGIWIDNEKKEYHDECIMIEIFSEDTVDKQRWFRENKEIWKKELDQLEIFILSQNAEIV